MFWSRPFFTLLLCACVASAKLVDDIVDGFKNAVSCGTCHALLVPMKGLAKLSDSTFSKTLTKVCKITGVVDDDVCKGIFQEQGPVVAHVLRSFNPLGQSATKFCNSVWGLCQQPDVNKYNVPFPKPAPTNPKVWVSKGRKPFQVSHFSDVHIDRLYKPGAEVECTKPICCRAYPDSPRKPAVPAGPVGAHKCDTSPKLIQSMLKTLPATNKFNIFTGDVIEASVWSVKQSSVTSNLKTFNNEMTTLLKTPVYPVIGNHEVAPVNLFPRDTSRSPKAAQWVFDTQAAGWTKWIKAAGANQVKHNSGSYSIVHPGTLLRIISINTGYWYKLNFWLYDDNKQHPDPNGIFAFLVSQLQAAEDAGQRAWIIGHMPPGHWDCLHDQSNYFGQIVQRYKNTIAAQFYGHTHQDQFQIAYSDYDNRNEANAVSMAWIAPSITPREGNPAFKTYDIDPDTYEVMDAHVFYANMASPTFQTSPTWTKYYSVRSTWGSQAGAKPGQPLNAAFWHRVTKVFESNNAAFKQYITFLNRGYNVPSCDAECKEQTICGLRAMRAEDNCQTTAPPLNLCRRDDRKKHHEPKCHKAETLDTIMTQFPSLVSNPKFNVTALKNALREIIGDAKSVWETPHDAQHLFELERA